ncbi:MAG: hypothetical protein IKC65_03330 [Lentisphaeria bacterium]|nr:hypothetical protein [Lentisphaeria bacterium]
MKKILFFLLVCTAMCSALEMEQKGRDVIFRTSRLQATVRDGRIVHLTSLKDGFVFADGKQDEPSDTAGLGNMNGRELQLSHYHQLIGDHTQKHQNKLGRIQLYRRPDRRSQLSVKREKASVTLTWKGLADHKKYYPEDFISIRFREDEKGALCFTSRGASQEKGVFGMQVSLDNLVSSGRFILPVYGGTAYSAGEGPKMVMSFRHTMDFYEAPVMTFEAGKNAVGMWSEDPKFCMMHAFVRRGKKSASFAFEYLNLMPFDDLKKTESREIKLNVFPGGSYLAAARPYRDWYRKTFAKELAQRDSTWAVNICSMVNNQPRLNHSTNVDELARIAGKENILFMFYALRKEAFDTNLPDHTPRPQVVKAVEELHRKGLRAMGYCIPFCVNKNSPLFKKDDLAKITLTKRHQIDNYQAIRDMGGQRWDNVPNGKLLYLDPLSVAWRRYIIPIHIRMLKESKLDALYEDTLGVAQDYGNGVINGASGPYGATLMAKELKAALKVPFATEYGHASSAFVSNWALIQAKIRLNTMYLLHNRYPLATYLFGYRPWAFPKLNETGKRGDLGKHLALSSADSLGGLGHFSFGPYLFLPGKYTMKSGMRDLCNLQAALYAQRGLRPYFPEEGFPEGVRSMFTDRKGGKYCYYDDGKLQQLCGPDGAALYGRLDSAEVLAHKDLTIPGWPVTDKGKLNSLDPETRYALFPGKDTGTALKTPALEKDVKVVTYRQLKDLLCLELEGKNGKKKTVVSLTLDKNFKHLWINGVKQKKSSGRFEVSLPGCITAAAAESVPGNTVSLVAAASGLKVGERAFPTEIRRVYFNQKMYQLDAGEIKYLDQLVKVKDKDTVFTVSYIYPPTGTRLSNASSVKILVNGQPAGEEFKAAEMLNPRKHPRYRYDNRFVTWRIPLGKFAGQSVLVSVRVDDEGDGYDDLQFLSVPRLTSGEQIFRMEKKALPVKRRK